MIRKILGYLFFRMYKIEHRSIRRKILTNVRRLENGDFYSKTLRKIFKYYYNVEIGEYSHGFCFIYGCADPETKIGRYCSIAKNVRIINTNHPMDFKSTHGFFFNPMLKYCKKDFYHWDETIIDHDVWIGYGAVIMPACRKIGTGAVVGAGAVVHKDVPPYAVVVGNPARIVRYRFDKETIEYLLESRWWEKSLEELRPFMGEMQSPFQEYYYNQIKGKKKAEKKSVFSG